MSEEELSERGRRIVAALSEFADDLEAGVPIESKYTVRQVRVVPPPQAYSPGEVRAVRQLIGASQEVFAQMLAVSPMTVRCWEQGSRKPSAMARRFLDEIRMAPGHFRGRIAVAATEVEPKRRTSKARTAAPSKATRTTPTKKSGV
jgi:putative transcriptional regulator